MTAPVGPGGQGSDALPASVQRIVDAVRVLRIELSIANDRVAAAAGINPRDLDVLDVIDRDAPCTPGHLVERTGIRAATLTGILARLESGGWVRRVPVPGDARSVELTPTGRFDELRHLYQPMTVAVARRVGPLPPDLQQELCSVLDDAALLVREAADGLASPPTASRPTESPGRGGGRGAER